MPNMNGRKTVIVEKDGETFEGTVQCNPNGTPNYVVYVHSLAGEEITPDDNLYEMIMHKAG
jgi:hypothetical protein